jgi:hypothetical protein
MQISGKGISPARSIQANQRTGRIRSQQYTKKGEIDFPGTCATAGEAK